GPTTTTTSGPERTWSAIWGTRHRPGAQTGRLAITPSTARPADSIHEGLQSFRRRPLATRGRTPPPVPRPTGRPAGAGSRSPASGPRARLVMAGEGPDTTVL